MTVRQGSQSYSDAACDSNSSADAMNVVSGHAGRSCFWVQVRCTAATSSSHSAMTSSFGSALAMTRYGRPCRACPGATSRRRARLGAASPLAAASHSSRRSHPTSGKSGRLQRPVQERRSLNQHPFAQVTAKREDLTRKQQVRGLIAGNGGRPLLVGFADSAPGECPAQLRSRDRAKPGR
jgi:hypothetical protein